MISDWPPINIHINYKGMELEGYALSYYYKEGSEGRTALAEEIVYIKHNNYLYSKSKKVVGYLKKFLRINPKLFDTIDLIVPIPGNIHSRNRMEDLARVLGEELHKPVLELISTNEIQPSYSKLKTVENQFSERESKFSIKNPSTEISTSRILLLDDVCTSGTTMIVCAKLLGNIGCKNVVPFVLCTSRILT